MSEPAPNGDQPPAKQAQPALISYIALLIAVGTGIAIAGARSGWDPPAEPNWVVLPVLASLLVGAEYFFIRFRYRGDVDALNLVEAVIAPLALGFSIPVVYVVVVVSQLVAGAIRRNSPIKVAFNAAQWGLAATVVSAILSGLSSGVGVSTDELPVILLALAAGGLVNQLAFTFVLAISNQSSPWRILKGLGGVIVPGWMAGWGMNSALGVLFCLAYVGNPYSVLFFIVPLAVLHLAYRGYAGSRSDRMRLTGLHRAARLLSGPLDPTDAIEGFLREVASAFEARSALLILRSNNHRVVHRLDMDDDRYSISNEDSETSFEGRLMRIATAKRIAARDPGSLAAGLRERGWRDCLAAPLSESEQIRGVVAVIDQVGLETFEDGEMAILESMARQIAVTLAKGRLLMDMVEEKRRYSEIFDSTSDGIAAVEADGLVRSWNPAMEKITGLTRNEVLGRPRALDRLDLRTPDQQPVDLGGWAAGVALPDEVEITSVDGEIRRLSCTFSATAAREQESALVVVARDVTPKAQIEDLKKEVTRAAAAEAAQRSLVDQLQEAIMPSLVEIEQTDLGLCYVASDPTAPTGGDLYDIRILPSGEVHIAVIDVLGHGVTATKDALDVIQTLRALAFQDVLPDCMVAEAHRMLSAQNPDLAATAIVGRYNPATGLVQLATGGHPPPLLISSDGNSREIEIEGGAIGWPGAGSDGISYVEMHDGDTLVFYTDGIVETGKDILAGTKALLETASGLIDLEARDLAEALVHRSLAKGVRRDDSLALTLRRTAGPVRPRVWWTIAPDGRHLPSLRHDMAAWLSAHRVSEGSVSEVKLVMSELVTNALAAARSRVSVDALFEKGNLKLSVGDDGEGTPNLGEIGFALPEPGAEGGRGLYVVRAITDQLQVDVSETGTVMTVTKMLTMEEEEVYSQQIEPKDSRDGVVRS